MMRLYSSFLVRHWRLEGGELRIKIEHVQSRERMRVDSLEEALAWVERRANSPPSIDGKAVPLKK